MIVAYENQIVMERTLEEALARLFSTTGARPAPPPARARRARLGGPVSAATPRLLQHVIAAERRARAARRRGAAHYERAVQAQTAGDWATYGEEIRLLGEVLDRMRSGTSRLRRPPRT